nr:protein K09H11.2 [imported] - Caenorhabditis elegans [Caenorhabditis elegans]
MDEIFRLAFATIMALVISALLFHFLNEMIFDLQVSSIGLCINTYVLRALIKKEGQLSIFYKLCISKSICNLITCFTFLVWSTPCTFLNFYYLPYWANVFWGQVAGWGAYITGIFIQICLSLNRLTVTYFPFSSNGSNNLLNMNTYQQAMFITRSENLSKKGRLMFAQSVTQDCLHMIDMLACQVIYKFNDALWFQFICMSGVWLTIHVFDGFVVFLFLYSFLPETLI